MTIYKTIDLTEDLEDVGSGAFNAAALAEIDATNMQIVQYLAGKLTPIAETVGALLNDGAGLAVVFDEGKDEVTIIGLARVEEENDQ